MKRKDENIQKKRPGLAHFLKNLHGCRAMLKYLKYLASGQYNVEQIKTKLFYQKVNYLFLRK